MVSKNTTEAIICFNAVLEKEHELDEYNAKLNKAISLIPEIELKYYLQRSIELRVLAEGKDLKN